MLNAALNPSFARGWNYSGLLSLFAGQLERAIEHAETALRLSPRARVGTTVGIIGTAHLGQPALQRGAA